MSSIFDQNNGKSHFRLLVGDKQTDEWVADDHCLRRNREAILPRVDEFPIWRFAQAIPYASRAFPMAKSMPSWTTSKSTARLNELRRAKQ